MARPCSATYRGCNAFSNGRKNNSQKRRGKKEHREWLHWQSARYQWHLPFISLRAAAGGIRCGRSNRAGLCSERRTRGHQFEPIIAQVKNQSITASERAVETVLSATRFLPHYLRCGMMRVVRHPPQIKPKFMQMTSAADETSLLWEKGNDDGVDMGGAADAGWFNTAPHRPPKIKKKRNPLGTKKIGVYGKEASWDINASTTLSYLWLSHILL